MDRTAWIAVILCIAGFILYQWFYTENYIKPREEAARKQQEQVVDSQISAPGSTSAATPTTQVGTTETPGIEPVPTPAPAVPQRTETISTPTAEYVFSNDAGGIERAVLLLHLGEKEEAIFLNGSSALPIGAIGYAPNEVAGGFRMKVDAASGEAIFTKTNSEGLETVKRFIPPAKDAENPYLLNLELKFRNTGDQRVERGEYFLSVGGAAPVHVKDLPTYTKFEWMTEGKMTGVDVNWFNPGGLPFLGIQWSGPKSVYDEEKPDATWAAVASQYFCTILTALDGPGNAAWATRYDTKKADNTPVYGMQGALGFPGFALEPGEVLTRSFSIYAGPKDLDLLREMGGGQDQVLSFGIFGFISELLLWGMNSLHGLVGSYAVSIILLTLIIKSLLWPVQNKATNEMRKMAALSPKMKEMREKYKDEPQKLNEEMMKMYREYGVNPFSGCLPMLIQIPIFFGFYAMLGSAIELRNSSFLWVKDLSQPDTIGHVLGFPINLLPIVMAGTMIWQMMITPKSGDKMQQRIFYFMPIIFLIFCYNYASALALYWTTQNIFSIVQLYLTRNRPLPQLEKKSVIAKREQLAAKRAKKPKKR